MAKKKTTKNNKKLSPLVIGLIIGAGLLLVGTVTMLIISNIPQSNEKPKMTMEEFKKQTEINRLDAIAKQIEIKAETYYKNNGVYPETIEDINESLDSLPDMVFNSVPSVGFSLAYTGVDGEKILYCSDDFAKLVDQCPKH